MKNWNQNATFQKIISIKLRIYEYSGHDICVGQGLFFLGHDNGVYIWYDIWYGVIRYMIWYDVIWYMILYDMIWYGMMWYDIYDMYDMI